MLLKDERNLKHMLNDGTFNKDYRKAFKKYWKKTQSRPGTMPQDIG